MRRRQQPSQIRRSPAQLEEIIGSVAGDAPGPGVGVIADGQEFDVVDQDVKVCAQRVNDRFVRELWLDQHGGTRGKTDRSAGSTRVRMVAQGATELYASMGTGRSIRRLDCYLACRATIVALTPGPLSHKGRGGDKFFNPIPGPSPLKWGRVTQRCRRDAKCGYAYARSEIYKIHKVALPLLSPQGERGSVTLCEIKQRLRYCPIATR